MSDVETQWDEYVDSMGSVMGEVEHMAQQMRDRIEELEAKLAVASHNATALGHKIVALEAARDKAWQACLDATTKGVQLEAKLAKAVEALEAGVICATKHGGAAEFLRIAHATLAELEASHAGKD